MIASPTHPAQSPVSNAPTLVIPSVAPEDDPLVGTVVAGRYEIERKIGEGGMGSVFAARQRPLGQPVALKILNAARCQDSHAVRRFLQEAQAISGLKHPHTIQLIDFGCTEDDRLFLVMPLLEGGELRQLIDRGRIDTVHALHIARQICGSLEEAHAHGIIHRDLKPENVVFDDIAGEPNFVKLLDFGVAHLETQDVATTIPGTRIGTVTYMAPEQHRGLPCDARSDLYSLGVVLYEMLMGEVPFDGESEVDIAIKHQMEQPRRFAQVAPDLSIDPEVEALCLRLLAKRPEDRFQSAGEVRQILESLLLRLDPQAQLFRSMPKLTAPPPPVSTEDEDFAQLTALQHQLRQMRLAAAICITCLAIALIVVSCL